MKLCEDRVTSYQLIELRKAGKEKMDEHYSYKKQENDVLAKIDKEISAQVGFFTSSATRQAIEAQVKAKYAGELD